MQQHGWCISLSLSLSWPGCLASRSFGRRGAAARSGRGCRVGHSRALSALASTVGVSLCATLGALLLWSAPALAVGDANEASCANEGLPGFRSYLADCRAYELVSSSIDGELQQNFAVSGGGAVLSESLGGAGGTANVPQLGAQYSFTRGASDWLTNPLNPPASLLGVSDELLDSEPAAVSSDFSKALFGLHSASEPLDAENLYISEPGGSFTEVGPDVPASALIGRRSKRWRRSAAPRAPTTSICLKATSGGASSDLSHIVFNLLGPATSGRTGQARTIICGPAIRRCAGREKHGCRRCMSMSVPATPNRSWWVSATSTRWRAIPKRT